MHSFQHNFPEKEQERKDHYSSTCNVVNAGCSMLIMRAVDTFRKCEKSMGDKSRIEWTESTWNPTTGCTKVSQGCKHCYAERDWTRLVHLPAYQGRAFTDVECHPERLDQPLRWKRPRRVFVNSMSDMFHESVPDGFIDRVFAVMALAKQHTFQVLTKRPRRMLDYCKTLGKHNGIDRVSIAAQQMSSKTGFLWHKGDVGWNLPNVHLGVSVEDQATADERIPLLLQTPAAVRWISAEPLLGPVDIQLSINRVPWRIGGGDAGLHWVVTGGESRPKARPTHPDWFRSLRDQCKAAGVPFLFKQWGEWQIASIENGHYDCNMAMNSAHWIHIDGAITKPSCLREDIPTAISCKAYAMIKVGKARAGRLLDGVLHDEYPA